MDIFRCLDRDNVTIICTEDTWENHILAEHPEMRGCEVHVRTAIEKPYQVFQDGRHPNVRIIYKPFILPKPFSLYYLRVAIKYRKRVFDKLRGYVASAFPCKNKRKGDILIWEEQ
jgi:hypothetical protein